MEKYNVIIEKDKEGNYIASVPSIQGCYTEAKDISTLLENIKEVIKVWREIDNEKQKPLEFIGLQTVEV